MVASTNNDDLVIRAVAALPTETLATLIKPGTEIFGDGRNIAVRLAALAEPTGICISGAVRDSIRDQLPYMFEDLGKRNLGIHTAPVQCYVMSAGSVTSRSRLVGQISQSRTIRLRSAAVAVSVFATVGVWSLALWSWLNANSSRAPIPAVVAVGSYMPSVGNTADRAVLAGSAMQFPLVSGRPGDRDIQAPSSQPTQFEIGAAVVRAKQASAAILFE